MILMETSQHAANAEKSIFAVPVESLARNTSARRLLEIRPPTVYHDVRLADDEQKPGAAATPPPELRYALIHFVSSI